MNLERATQDFWTVSLAYHKRKESAGISTGAALSILNTHLALTDMPKRLWFLIHDLSFNIVQGKTRKHA